MNFVCYSRLKDSEISLFMLNLLYFNLRYRYSEQFLQFDCRQAPGSSDVTKIQKENMKLIANVTMA